jgi:hypothetical protein
VQAGNLFTLPSTTIPGVTRAARSAPSLQLALWLARATAKH